MFKGLNKVSHLQLNLLMWSPLLRDGLLHAATFSVFFQQKYIANEPVLRVHLSKAAIPWVTP